MASDNSQNNFRRGVMSLGMLALLKKEDRTAYDSYPKNDIRSTQTEA